MNTITAPPRAPKSSTSTIESSTTESPGTGASQAGPERPGFLGSIPEAWYDRVILAALGVLAAVLSVWNVNGATVYQDDEGTYTAQAFSVLGGELAPYAYGYDHPPLGWVLLGALVWIPDLLGLGGDTFIGAARYAMAPFFVATALLVYLIARRLRIRRPIAALTVVLVVLSPLTLTIGRQVYLDNIGLPWLLLAFYLALSRRDALWHHVGAGAFFAVAVLSKETLAIFGPALMVALLNRPSWSNRTFSLVGFLTVGGLVLGFYPLLALLRAELVSGEDHLSLQDGLAYQFLDRSGSGAVWEAGSSRAGLLEGWLYYDQHLIVAGLVAALICLSRRRTVWIPVAIASFSVPVVMGSGYLPGMYIIGVLPFLALAVGAALNALMDALGKLTAPLPAGRRTGFKLLAVACTAFVLFQTAVPQWWTQSRALLTQQVNGDWASALEWVEENVPRDETVLVPYSLWQDLNPDGTRSPWTVVATEKADLDPQFLLEHPEGWTAIDWVVQGPDTDTNIEIHDLTMAGEALENSVPVQTFGEWSVHRVRTG